MSEISSILVSILPYAIGAAISPAIFTLTVDVFKPFKNERLHLFSYYFGSIAILILLMLMGMFIGSNISANILGPINTGARTEVFLGGILIIIALNNLFVREEPRDDGFFGFIMSIRENNDLSIFIKYLYIGFIVILANIATSILILGAGNIIGLANPNFWIAVGSIFVFGLITLLGIEIPLIIYLLRPQRSEDFLNSTYRWMAGNSYYIIVLVLILLGIFFILRGTLFLY